MELEHRVTLQKNVSLTTWVNGTLVESQKLTYKAFVAYLEANDIAFKLACPCGEMFHRRAELIEKAGYMITPVISEFKSGFHKWRAARFPGGYSLGV